MAAPASDFEPPGTLEQRAREDLPLSARAFERWLRGRLIEHWYGQAYWRELDRGDFGLLCRPIHANDGLVTDIVALVLAGHENLTILVWALETGRPLDQTVEILTALDINTRRLPRFAWMVAPRRCVPAADQAGDRGTMKPVCSRY